MYFFSWPCVKFHLALDTTSSDKPLNRKHTKVINFEEEDRKKIYCKQLTTKFQTDVRESPYLLYNPPPLKKKFFPINPHFLLLMIYSLILVIDNLRGGGEFSEWLTYMYIIVQ